MIVGMYLLLAALQMLIRLYVMTF